MKSSWMPAAIAVLMLSGCNKSKEPAGTVFVSGRIDGDTVEISSKIAGRIVNLAVREGDPVQPGQVLAWLSSPQEEAIRDTQKARIVSDQRIVDQLTAELGTYDEKVKQAELYKKQAEMDAPGQVQQAEANVAVSKAELNRWEEELEQAQMDAKRYPSLAKTGAVAVQTSEQYQTKEQIALASVDASRKQVAVAEAALQRARAQLENIPIQEASRQTLLKQMDAQKQQIDSARATVDADQAALRKIEADIADLSIQAPIAGTILTRSAEPGRVIQPGQTILTMVDLNKLYLRGFVPEGEVGKVKVGQQAQVWLDSNPGQAIPAQVIRVDPEVMFTPENTYFKDDRVKQVMGLKIGLQGAYGYAKPGMPADGRIQVQSGPPKG
ncbi:MAG TPA: HlyD family efflux transporter periplasmic adaptor subunit [Bryobacteraceae bacterium]|jgi:HlyD family secretion protein